MEIHFCFDCGHCMKSGKSKITGEDVYECAVDDLQHSLWIHNRFHVPCEDWIPKERDHGE